jgi:hypothetical protein
MHGADVTQVTACAARIAKRLRHKACDVIGNR